MSPRPFFIVGSDRSGTTMLRLMLNEHSRLHVPPESWFLIDLLSELPCGVALSDASLQLALAVISQHRRWPHWGIDEGKLRRVVLSLRKPTLSELVNAVFGLWNPAKARWGDKTPQYVFEIERLHRLFPAAQFIHVIRDGRDVCLSLYRTRWRGSETVQIARYWRDCVATGRVQGSRLPAGLYLEVAYEDLVVSTEHALRQICDFLGERFEPAMLRFYEHAERHIPPWERQFHTRCMRPTQPTDVGRWRREMARLKVATFEAMAGGTMDLVGQPRAYLGWSRLLPWAIRAGYGLADASLPLRRMVGLHFPLLRKRF